MTTSLFSRTITNLILIFSLGLTACSAYTSGTSDTASNDPALDVPTESETEPFAYIPLLWETRTSTTPWSIFLLTLIRDRLPDMIDAADDMKRFCPGFASLSRDQKVNVWGVLISAITKYESGFNPLARMKETTMGTDPVTGKAVYSEGLMQLSYQDIQGWPFCKFDWNKDKYLAAKDPRKTILDPFINLDCGTRILAQQIARKKNIVLSSGVYWAVIKENGRYQQIANIASSVRSRIPACR